MCVALSRRPCHCCWTSVLGALQGGVEGNRPGQGPAWEGAQELRLLVPAGWGPLVMGAQLREGGVQFQTVASGDQAPSAHTSVRSGSSPEVSREALDPGGQGPRRLGLGVGVGPRGGSGASGWEWGPGGQDAVDHGARPCRAQLRVQGTYYRLFLTHCS